ncbi:MAG: saccharopine dehydrogenase [Marinosulfonomonas sp.]|nr:saccharopine dehydrogenase [Marinosulfonomonas sp.]
MTHLWVRAEQRDHEERVGITPEGAASLIAAGLRVSIENSATRAIQIDGYEQAGCQIVPENSWPDAPADAIIFGLKELPDDGTALRHSHIMFGHAYKDQPDGQILLQRFRDGGGTLYDLEYLTDDSGRRVAAFGYWAGFAGAAVALKCWAALKQGDICDPVATYENADALIDDVSADLNAALLARPNVIVIGALGRVGSGARDLCAALDVATTDWDMAETASGGPFPKILEHDVFLNCILAAPGCPVFVPASTKTAPRQLSVIGDIACDPTSEFSPIKVYDATTTWDDPALRVHDNPPLDVTAIDNLPSLLPLESSQDFARQLLPSLLTLDTLEAGVWARAKKLFDQHIVNI